MSKIEELRQVLLKKVIKGKPKVKADIFDKCVEMKKLSRVEATNIENGTINLDTVDDQKLFWILKNSIPVIPKLGKMEDYFTELELRNYEYFEVDDQTKVSYPLKFENVENLKPNEIVSKQYGFYLTVKEIKRLHSAGILQVIPELQRGGVKNAYDELKTKVNKSRVAQIAERISEGEYFFNSISFNLINDDNAIWDYDGSKLYIEKGLIIVPDGNHRAFACESIPDNDPHMDDKFHVLFTVLTPAETKKKIAQEWNTEPISKSQKEYMVINNSNRILDMVLRDDDLDDLIKKNIATSSDKRLVKSSIYVYSDISKAIQKYYNGNKISTREEQRELSDWLVMVFNRVAFLFGDDLKNASTLRRKKWNLLPYAMYGFIYLSKELYKKPNWKTIFDQCIRSIDFSNTADFTGNSLEKTKILEAEKIFREVFKNVQ